MCLLACSAALTGETRWIKIATPDFEMYSTSGDRAARDTLRFFEQIRSFFAGTLPNAFVDTGTVRIVAFSSEKEYQPYRPNEFATAYYHPTSRHDYIVMSHTGAETSPIAIHEFVHLVVQHSNLKLPPWLNEGVAELFSTIKPMGDKMLVGSLIPGRYQALLQESWVPLATIMAAGHDSPYYNEKNKAGSLYNEGWAMTHMLALGADYRSKFGQVLQAISSGTPSADALEQIYGKPLKQIENDLHTYWRSGRFQGNLVPFKMEKIKDELGAEAADPFDVKVLLAEIGDRPNTREATRKTLEALIAENPKRADVYVDLADLEWRQQQVDAAAKHFGSAFDLGERSPRMLWDYGRLAASSDPAKSAQALSELLKLQPNRLEVRLELASSQLRSHAAKDALETLAPVKKVTPKDAPRLLTLLAHANLEAGDHAMASAAAKQLKQVATDPEDRDHADQILRYIESADAAQSARFKPAFDGNDSRPRLVHRDAGVEPVRPLVRRASYEGNFAELQCGGQARVVVQTADGKKVLVIEGSHSGLGEWKERRDPGFDLRSAEASADSGGIRSSRAEPSGRGWGGARDPFRGVAIRVSPDTNVASGTRGYWWVARAILAGCAFLMHRRRALGVEARVPVAFAGGSFGAGLIEQQCDSDQSVDTPCFKTFGRRGDGERFWRWLSRRRRWLSHSFSGAQHTRGTRRRLKFAGSGKFRFARFPSSEGYRRQSSQSRALRDFATLRRFKIRSR